MPSSIGMPSDDRTRLAIEALRGLTGRFRSALAATADEVRSYLAAHQSTLEGRVGSTRAGLGPFGASHIDAERFAALFDHKQQADPIAIETIEESLSALTELMSLDQELFLVTVTEGGSLRDAVAGALEEIGRAFAAARVVLEARAGRHRLDAHAGSLGALAFSRWTRGERHLAPSLIVEVYGSDLLAASLSEFLDGRQKIVLVVKGDECAPAPLVRLVTPGTFVLQTDDGSGLDRMVAWDGPGVAALVPSSAARFVHDPAAGAVPWERIAIAYMPEVAPRKAVGGLSAAQQAEELELLRALAAKPAGAEPRATEPGSAAAQATAPASSDPVDRLAAWLLSQADLSDLR